MQNAWKLQLPERVVALDPRQRLVILARYLGGNSGSCGIKHFGRPSGWKIAALEVPCCRRFEDIIHLELWNEWQKLRWPRENVGRSILQSELKPAWQNRIADVERMGRQSPESVEENRALRLCNGSELDTLSRTWFGSKQTHVVQSSSGAELINLGIADE